MQTAFNQDNTFCRVFVLYEVGIWHTMTFFYDKIVICHRGFKNIIQYKVLDIFWYFRP